MTTRSDLVLVGGGLANGLIAWRLRQTRPELRIVVLERGTRLGGNHTWSFHGGDLRPAEHRWVSPLVAHSWDSHEVRFPSYRRRLAGAYHSITSERFHDVLSRDLADCVRFGTEVARVDGGEVQTEGGEVFRAEAVIDGRGARPTRAIQVAYQKFLGLSVELENDHGLDGPILMDATVEQQDGFRFMYTLPFARRRALVEDTRYSDTAGLDSQAVRAEIRGYCEARGWRLRKIEGDEQGVLPIVLSGNIDALWAEIGDVPVSGMRAGLFHHTTGYSLPEAVRLADDLAQCGRLVSTRLHDRIRIRAGRQWKRQRYFRFLNRMMFRAAEPGARYRILERFYRLPEVLIERFYSARLSWWDRVRILSGKPPVPVRRALRCVRER